MRTHLIRIVFLLSWLVGGLWSQALCDVHPRPVGLDAVKAFDDVRRAAHVSEGVYFLYQSSDQPMRQYGGAAAIACNGGSERWIVYDPTLIRGDLALRFALAHELAHHEHNDSLSGQPRSVQQELEADRSAAEYLASPPTNWSKEMLIKALNDLQLPSAAQGVHPSLDKRIEQVTAGYDTAIAILRPPPGPQPQPAPKAGIRSFTASPDTLTQGSGTTLRWSIDNARSAKITTDSSDDDPGDVDSTSGSKLVRPSESQTFTLTAVGPGGDSVTRALSVKVDKPQAKPSIESFTASVSSVTKGSGTTLRWSIENARSAKITTDSSDDDIGDVDPSSGSKRVSPTEDQTYTLTAVGVRGDSVTDTVSVKVRSTVPDVQTGSYCANAVTGARFCRLAPLPVGAPCYCNGVPGVGVVVP